MDKEDKTMKITIDFDDIELMEAGQRIYDFDPYEARNNDETPETLAEAITKNPIGIINFLLDRLED